MALAARRIPGLAVIINSNFESEIEIKYKNPLHEFKETLCFISNV